MYIIGITGGTGSGKSTFSRLLAAKIPTAEMIDGDKLMNKTLRYYEEDFFRIFGEKIQLDSKGRTKLCFFTKHPARIKQGIEIANRYLRGDEFHTPIPDQVSSDDSLTVRLTAAIDIARKHFSDSIDARINHLPEGKTIAIIDWVNLPFLDIWNKCDLKIVMTADDRQRFLRLKERKKGMDFTEKEIVNMIENAILPYDQIDYDMHIVNNRLAALEQYAKEISQMLKDKPLPFQTTIFSSFT